MAILADALWALPSLTLLVSAPFIFATFGFEQSGAGGGSESQLAPDCTVRLPAVPSVVQLSVKFAEPKLSG